ncbi:hypothetical protein L1049_009038 [Liquidambar formosana]|uniref:Uncharacterized protein n=1 Tax=Liquidambar formosana TaxID=63359 RepID=A0AAP0X4Y2_LIQFO
MENLDGGEEDENNVRDLNRMSSGEEVDEDGVDDKALLLLRACPPVTVSYPTRILGMRTSRVKPSDKLVWTRFTGLRAVVELDRLEFD